MDLEKVKEELYKDRERLECSFVFCFWKEPTLYDDYKEVNVGEDNTLIVKDAIFYFQLGRALRKQGLNTFDNISVSNYLSVRPQLYEQFEQYGGWHEVEHLRSLVSTDNLDSYYDGIVKKNALLKLATKTDEMFNDLSRFDTASSEDVYKTFDLLNSSAIMTSKNESRIDNLMFSASDYKSLESGEDQGVSYYEAYPLLNYTTLGLPIGDIMLISGHSGAGKTSFTFYMMIAIALGGSPVTIVSNEMQLKQYKQLLLMYVLTHDLDYYKLTRKKLKTGEWDDEQRLKIKEAIEIINTKYTNIYFIKIFGNDASTVMRQMKRANRLYGSQVFMWDTYKSDDTSGDKMWQELLMSSRRVFNLVAKEKWSLVCTFQLALYTTNQRYLDAGCLSNSKQIKEVVSEHIMMRKLWHDEYTNEKFDCKPYKFNRQTKAKEFITLDPDKTYIVIFIDKTRNDENARCILYQWDSVWNKWTEIGYCNILNDHRGV